MKRRFSWQKRLLGSVFDVLTAPLALIARLDALARRTPKRPVRRVLVVELWGIGDAVLATCALAALRRALPDAHLAVLVKPHAATLFENSGIVDEVVAFDFPWTSPSEKYALRRYDVRSIWGLLRRLRRQRYDISLDARTDPRNHLLTLLAGVRRRFGFAHGSGSWLLTDRVPAGDPERHRVDDWLGLVRAAGVADVAPSSLSVSVTEEERARKWLRTRGLNPARLLVGIHPGASHAVRRWDLARFAAVADALSERHEAQIIVFADEKGYGEEMPTKRGHAVARVALRELMGLMRQCDLLVCNESGPMHLATALGIPVVAIFTSMNPAWFGPRGSQDRVVMRSEFPCRPCFDRCVFDEPYCNTSISVAEVLTAAEEQLLCSAGPVDERRAVELSNSPASRIS